MSRFDCLRCGDCCTNLRKETTEGVLSGLALFPEETKHFPKESISPYRGIGAFPEERKFQIVMFQLHVDTCPHFEKVGERAICRIYEKRPLSCKCFPFQPIDVDRYGRHAFYADPGCRVIQKMKGENLKTESRKAQLEAPREERYGYLLWDRVAEIPFTDQEWTFDLKYQEWLPSVHMNLRRARFRHAHLAALRTI